MVGLVGLLIAGAFLFGCKGEHRTDSDQVASPSPEARETPAASSPEGSVERVNAPAPNINAPSSTETTSSKSTENVASPRHDEEADADDGASSSAHHPPTAIEAAADEPASELDGAADEAPTLDEVLERHGDELRGIRGVVGVAAAECNGAPCIRITVARRTQALLSQLPSAVEGFPVSVVEHRGGH